MGLLLWPAALSISLPGAESRATRFYRIYNQPLNQSETFWCTPPTQIGLLQNYRVFVFKIAGSRKFKIFLFPL